MKHRQRIKITNRYWLIFLSTICVGFMVMSVYSDQLIGPFKIIANGTVIPIQTGVNHVGIWLSDITSNFQTIQELRISNEQLQARIDELTIENQRLSEDRIQFERLQALYQLDQSYADFETIAASVINKEPGNWFANFTINRGSIHGIKPDMNVIAGNGLVGIVTKVGPTWANVRSIIDDSSNVSAMMMNTSDTCIVRGDLTLMNDGRIRFELLENNENVVAVGDPIVTSHISSAFLQGILIGYVSEINIDSNNLTRSGLLTPVVNFRNLQEVLVITTRKADLTPPAEDTATTTDPTNPPTDGVIDPNAPSTDETTDPGATQSYGTQDPNASTNGTSDPGAAPTNGTTN